MRGTGRVIRVPLMILTYAKTCARRLVSAKTLRFYLLGNVG
jgi:hypothetical protein